MCRYKALASTVLLLCTAASPSSKAALTEFSNYCGGGTALWGHSLCGPIVVVDPQTRDAIANADPGLPTFARQDGLWTGTLPKDVSVANTSIELGGRGFAEVVLPLPDDPIERRILLTHESFHRIQPDLGFHGSEADNAQLDTKAGRIFARLEAAALRTALTQKKWRPPARDALAYRAERLRLFAGAEQKEAALLANEGLAEYTGVRVGANAAATSMALKRLKSVNERPSLIRSFGYVVGPAYGLLLDRLSPSWRKAALKGVPVPSLLVRAIGTSHLTRNDRRYGRAAIVAEETARDVRIQQRRAELTAKFLKGPIVIFPFEAMKIDFNPNTLFSLGEAGTVYAQSTTVRDKWGSFHATGDVLIAPDWSYAHLPGPAGVNGNHVSGPQWTAELVPGYALAPGASSNEQAVKKQ